MAVTLRGLISDAPWRAFALAIISLMLGGCMQATLAPTTQAGWNTRFLYARCRASYLPG